MIKTLELNHVGPSEHLEIEFGDRLTVFTGDNGLGKSFVLDVAWWMLTKEWAGEMAMPQSLINASYNHSEQVEPVILGRFDSINAHNVLQQYIFQRLGQVWNCNSRREEGVIAGNAPSDSIVVYMKCDDTVAMYDPVKAQADEYARLLMQEHSSHYENVSIAFKQHTTRIYTQAELWNGVQKKRRQEFNGLISDWGDWQRESSFAYECLKKGVEHLSPKGEPYSIGSLRRVKADDSRKFPSIRSVLGKETPLIYASAGIRKILSLLYAMTWAWAEHIELCEKYTMKPASKIILMLDEVESHLHPQWQRSILKSLESVMGSLLVDYDVSTQLICTTHSPLVLASLDPIFDEEKDALYTFDMNRETCEIELKREEWVRRGSSAAWLTSPVFGLETDSSEQREEAIKEAKLAVRNRVSEEEARVVHEKLVATLHQADPFWSFWRTRAEKRGWKL
ncbi:AAA family ATPase [Halodesulfovibrio marinisediminis]|uniref:Predicted ATP-binding protein involved in virulence n=1 Tax=Halodesulfovibrio marinisediminis DSM 17456 TaxID=1121457 RepID=A0A1N6I1M3_9BACT|nr:ATP-binding protein [Halodesulfovibrio marinisediminis]SIO25940.1 Predicted ATP-binding protein involved in virulence [Halodesulfovibrio marinisediminis DSM 17456]